MLTMQDCYNLEVQISGQVICPHGRAKDVCNSSQCYIHSPADEELDPDHVLTPSEVLAWAHYMAGRYDRELYYKN